MGRLKVGGSGPLDARIMIVGEAPGATEEERGMPFQGAAGVELTKMLVEAGIDRSQCRITNVCKYRPPGNEIDRFFGSKKEGYPLVSGRYPHEEIVEGMKELEEEIAQVKPTLIIALGGTPLWALAGKEGITKWRGSILTHSSGAWIIPTYHPAGILRNWPWRYVAVHDLRRAKRLAAGEIEKPITDWLVRPNFSDTMSFLRLWLGEADRNPLILSVDIETRGGQIACIGIASGPTTCICIPFMEIQVESQSYWTLEQELEIVLLMRDLLTHQHVRVVGQNFSYDSQYFLRQYLFAPRLAFDTMIVHHTLFPGLPKGLDFLASLYLDWYEYWKDESKEWNPKTTPEDQLWEYNCKDAINTLLIARELERVRKEMGMKETSYGHPVDMQLALFPVVLSAMSRGVKVDESLKRNLILELQDQIMLREQWLHDVVGRPLNANSPKQLQAFFYEELGQRKIFNYKGKSSAPTTGADALDLIAQREPLLSPIVQNINETRRLRNALSFCSQPLDLDKRIRCSYNIAGTETFRFSSSEDAFGFGTNLQNVTSGEGEQDPLKRKPGEFFIPNLRRLFTPDPGYILGDFDLKAADAQIVAAEAGEWELLNKIREGYPLHDENAKRWGIPRPLAKAAVHGTNYGASAFGLAKNLGLSQDKCQMIIDDWLTRHPGIAGWHESTKMDLMTKRYVENIFGYRRFYFERIDDSLLKEALAWRPQSTIAIVTNLGIRQVLRSIPFVHLLLQVHDSSVFQWPKLMDLFEDIRQAMKVKIPYKNELIIDVDGHPSELSWGHCK